MLAFSLYYFFFSGGRTTLLRIRLRELLTAQISLMRAERVLIEEENHYMEEALEILMRK